MKIGRRGFLKVLGLTPVAGKVAVDAAVAEASGVEASGLAAYGMAGIPPNQSYAGPAGSTQKYDPYEAASEYVKIFGIPKFHEDQLRDQAYHVQSLDPDIAVKRSWSMSVKIQTQRQRNYERLVAQLHYSAKRSVGRRTMETILGGYWPW